jgi:hypothetical protein
MSPTAATSMSEQIPPAKLDFVAGFLSYLIPGLGQIMQGRIAKGVVFFVSLYALFFYGWSLGQRRNVYLPDSDGRANTVQRLLNDLYNRPHFAGQFFIGIAAWPAIWQYHHYDDAKDEGPVFGRMMRAPKPDEINRLQREESKTWDLGWVYTVIAGVLNILVIYDAIAGPAFRQLPHKDDESAQKKSETATA